MSNTNKKSLIFALIYVFMIFFQAYSVKVKQVSFEQDSITNLNSMITKFWTEQAPQGTAIPQFSSEARIINDPFPLHEWITVNMTSHCDASQSC